MASKEEKIKRYNLALPVEVFDAIKKIADEQHTSVLEMLRKFVKLGLLVVEIEKKPNSALVIREGDTERQVLML